MRDPDNPLDASAQAVGYVDSVLRMGAAERETTAAPASSAVVLLRVVLAVHALVAILGAAASLLH